MPVNGVMVDGMNLRNFLAAAVVTVHLATPAFAQQQPASDDLQSIRQEIESLRKGQEAIQKELQEIKALLRARPAAAAQKPAPGDIKVTLDGEPVRGSASAKAILIEYSDYQCPFCQRVVRDAMPQVQAEYIATGRLRHVYKDLPLEAIHPNAFRAAVAAECAREHGRFWEMHDKMFENSKQLGGDQLIGYAKEVGLDAPKFAQCLESGRFDAEIRDDMREARVAGVGGTPAFLVGTVDANGNVTIVSTLYGAQPFEAFKKAIDAVLVSR